MRPDTDRVFRTDSTAAFFGVLLHMILPVHRVIIHQVRGRDLSEWLDADSLPSLTTWSADTASCDDLPCVVVNKHQLAMVDASLQQSTEYRVERTDVLWYVGQ